MPGRQIPRTLRLNARAAAPGAASWVAISASGPTRSRQINCLQPVMDGIHPFRRLIYREGALNSQAINRSRAFDGNQLARHESVVGL